MGYTEGERLIRAKVVISHRSARVAKYIGHRSGIVTESSYLIPKLLQPSGVPTLKVERSIGDSEST